MLWFMVKKNIKVDFQNNLIEALLKCRKNWLKKLEFITNRIYRCHAVVCCREPDAFETNSLWRMCVPPSSVLLMTYQLV
jgi:hypothetical protein